MVKKIRRALEHRHADRAIVALSALLVSASLTAGLAADDYLHQLILEGSRAIEGFRRHTLDLFRFASPEHNRALLDEGIFPWWADPDVRFAFWRPLSALTHWVDHQLWPRSAVLMHAHSIVWWVLAALTAGAAYRSLIEPRWVATLALLLYALDDARGAPVAWVANRNALVAFAVNVWTLVLHHRGRAEGRRALTLLAPAVFATSLLAGEGSIAILAYLFAYALFLDPRSARTRVVSLLPYAAVTLGWAALTRALGYGVRGSGVYLDPIGEPLLFLRHLPERLTVLLFAQLGGPWSEGYNAYRFMVPGFEIVVLAAAFFVFVFTGLLLAPLWRKNRRVPFWVVGTVLAGLPSCAAFPADRLLPWVGIGGSAALAEFFGAYVDERSGLGATGFRRRLADLGAIGVVALHMILGPLMLPMRSRGIAQVRAALERAENTVPRDPSIENKTVIYVNPPADPFASFLPITREALGIPRPSIQRWLATGVSEVEIERTGEQSLLVRQAGGFLQTPSEKLLRGPHAPLGAGRKIDLVGMQVEIAEQTPNGRPLSAHVRFNRPLEDPSFTWLVWKGAGYVPFDLPAPGEKVRVPPVDLVMVAWGEDSAVTRALR